MLMLPLILTALLFLALWGSWFLWRSAADAPARQDDQGDSHDQDQQQDQDRATTQTSDQARGEDGSVLQESPSAGDGPSQEDAQPPADDPTPPLSAHLVFEEYTLSDDHTMDLESAASRKLMAELLPRLKQRRVTVLEASGLSAQLAVDGVPFALRLEELGRSPARWHLGLWGDAAQPCTQAELDHLVKQLRDALHFLAVTTPVVMTPSQWQAQRALERP